jgi:hypothetical protein
VAVKNEVIARRDIITEALIPAVYADLYIINIKGTAPSDINPLNDTNVTFYLSRVPFGCTYADFSLVQSTLFF